MDELKWSEDTEKFKSEPYRGAAFQAIPLAFLVASKLPAVMPETTFRANFNDASAWQQTRDIMVGGLRIEVKSRGLRFTSPLDWPSNMRPAFLDVTKKWDAQAVKPFAYVFVSQPTGAMVATKATKDAQPRWGRVTRRDHVRGSEYEFYTVDTKYLVTMDVLVEALKSELDQAAVAHG